MEQVHAGIIEYNVNYPVIADLRSEEFREIHVSIMYNRPLCLYVAILCFSNAGYQKGTGEPLTKVFDSKEDATAFCFDWITRQEKKVR